MALLGVGSSNITSGLVSSITGEANKAYMLFRNPDYLPQGTDKKPDVAAGLDTMIGNLQKKPKPQRQSQVVWDFLRLWDLIIPLWK